MQVLKQSTAATVLVGPILDSSGNAVTSAAVGDFRITKNGSTGTLGAPSTATHSHNGHYTIGLSVPNVDTVGRLELTSGNTDHAMPAGRFQVVSAAVYNLLFAADSSGQSISVIAGGLAPDQLVQETDLSAFVGETRSFTIAVVDSAGAPVSLAGLDLVICIERDDETNVEIIEGAGLTIAGNQVSFSTTVANEKIGGFRWSLRKNPEKRVLLIGRYDVDEAALA